MPEQTTSPLGPIAEPGETVESPRLPHSSTWLQPAEDDARLVALLRQMRAILTELDGQGRIVSVSRNVSEISGYTREELTGRRNPDMVHPEDLPQVEAVGEALRAGLDPPSVRFRSRHKSGHWISVEAASATRFVRPDA